MSDKKLDRPLLSAARKTARHAYAPYSGFSVGAAVETIDGKIFSGANMENASFGVTICAEVGALQAASSAGYLNKIRKIAIAGGATASNKRTSLAVTPCGRCRQLIFESARLSGLDIEVICADLDLHIVKKYRISDLLPHGFGPSHLLNEKQSKVRRRQGKHA